MNIIFVSRTLEDHGLAGKFILTISEKRSLYGRQRLRGTAALQR